MLFPCRSGLPSHGQFRQARSKLGRVRVGAGVRRLDLLTLGMAHVSQATDFLTTLPTTLSSQTISSTTTDSVTGLNSMRILGRRRRIKPTRFCRLRRLPRGHEYNGTLLRRGSRRLTLSCQA